MTIIGIERIVFESPIMLIAWDKISTRLVRGLSLGLPQNAFDRFFIFLEFLTIEEEVICFLCPTIVAGAIDKIK